ncbi:MAG TPA: hypothetical protein VFC63_11355 [Blastocatellia bacterium]|nr:hypothetical protein [Blastocatellia bacterium]
MNYRGRIKGSIVVFENDARIPDGAEVMVTLVAKNRLADYAGVLLQDDVEEMRRLIIEMRQPLVEEKVC